jgi:hypothetical protein
VVGQAKLRRRKLAELVEHEPRCIYCANKPTTIEHMPPIALFRTKARPRGMEFAACSKCNEGTRGADLVASFFARLDRQGDKLLISEAVDRKAMLRMRAPGVLEELLRPGSEQRIWRNERGVFQQMSYVQADGPLTRSYLTVFTAKFAMALYREHVGEALPLEGGVHTNWFLNAGLSQKAADTMLSIMPMVGTLTQGRFAVPEQFSYRFNTDGRSVVAALASFHSNFHVFVMAAADPKFYRLPLPLPLADFLQPGQLVGRLSRSGSLAIDR